jgi:hypothetical protein
MVIYLDGPKVAGTIGIAWRYTPDQISKYFSVGDQESQLTPTETTQTFTYFPKPPFEFRNKILKLACFETRNGILIATIPMRNTTAIKQQQSIQARRSHISSLWLAIIRPFSCLSRIAP